jgi:hypothetical protein
MKPYVTAAKFREMGFGVDVSNLEDPALTALCARATSLVDAYCLVPRLPNGANHDFRGGSVVSEQHTWRYPASPVDIGQRRAYPFHWPVTGVTRFIIKVTNTQYVSIAPSELFINGTQKYVEVVSLAITSSGLFNALVVPNIGLATPVVELDYTYGRTFAETGERLAFSDGQTWRAANQWWAQDPAPVIYKNGTPMTVTTDYTIDFDEGTVILVNDAEDTDVITADYSFRLPWEVRDATGHIVAALQIEAGKQASGIAGLRRLTVEEVTLEQQRFQPGQASIHLEALSPEAAMLLATYRFDSVTVR